MDLPASSFVCHLSLLTVKSVDLMVAHDGFLEKSSIIFISATLLQIKVQSFQTVVDLYCCVTG